VARPHAERDAELGPHAAQLYAEREPRAGQRRAGPALHAEPGPHAQPAQGPVAQAQRAARAHLSVCLVRHRLR
jgi:hypothetical protein